MEPLTVVLATLRLFKGKAVWLTSVTACSNSPFEKEGLTWSPFEWTGYRCDPHCTNTQEPYMLERDEVKDLSVSWEVLWESHHNTDHIRRSIDLYNEAFEQSTHVAAFLRIWGAIEAAFIAPGTRRIAEASATTLSELLAPVGQAREDIKRRLRESYRCRSQVVHGGRQLSEADIFSSCAFASRCYRHAILTHLGIQAPSRAVR